MLVYWKQEWARDGRFDSFWRHFEASERWRRNHREVKEKEEELQGKSKRPRIQGKGWKLERGSEMEREETQEGPSREVEEGREEETVQMDEEMKEFFRKTMQHRAEREAKRNAEKKEDAKNKVDGIQSRSLAAPNEPAALEEKRKQARAMYGDNWEKIMSMECEMEMKFRRIFDETKPPMWPVIPFRL